MSGHHHDRKSDPHLHQLEVEIEFVHVGQADVNDDASWFIERGRSGKFVGGLIGLSGKSDRVEQTFQSASHRRVIIDDVDNCLLACVERHCEAPLLQLAR